MIFRMKRFGSSSLRPRFVGPQLKDLIAEFVEHGLAAGAAAVPVRHSRSPLPVVRSATGTPHPALSNAELEDMLSHEDRHWPSAIFPT